MEHARRDSIVPELLRELRASALIARLPRRVVDQYVAFSRTAYGMNLDSLEHTEEGGILAAFNHVVEDSASLLAGLAWNPWIRRRRLGRRSKALDERAKALGDEHTDVQRHLTWASRSVR